MKNLSSSLVVATLLITLSFPAQAEWSKSFEVNYIMGDSDNRISARQAALEQIKLKASSEAGTYIHGTTTLHESGELTESIQMLSASMVKVAVSGEKLFINQTDQMVLMIKATASIDDSELSRRVEILQRGKDKEQQVKQLLAENLALRRDYDEIRKELATQLNPSRAAEMLKKQDVALGRIRENGNSMALLFEAGTILKIAENNDNEFEEVKRTIDSEFFDLLLRTPVAATVESVEPTAGGKFAVKVNVNLIIDMEKAHKVLSKYLNVKLYANNSMSSVMSPKRSHINIRKYNNESNIKHLSSRIYQYLAQKQIGARISIAGDSIYLPVFFSGEGKSFMDMCDYSKQSDESLCLITYDSTSDDLEGMGYHTKNPIIFLLTREQAASATQVKAEMVE